VTDAYNGSEDEEKVLIQLCSLLQNVRNSTNTTAWRRSTGTQQRFKNIQGGRQREPAEKEGRGGARIPVHRIRRRISVIPARRVHWC
jgi:hypothetical protein